MSWSWMSCVNEGRRCLAKGGLRKLVPSSAMRSSSPPRTWAFLVQQLDALAIEFAGSLTQAGLVADGHGVARLARSRAISHRALRERGCDSDTPVDVGGAPLALTLARAAPDARLGLGPRGTNTHRVCGGHAAEPFHGARRGELSARRSCGLGEAIRRRGAPRTASRCRSARLRRGRRRGAPW
jgi:hypothetical protein